MNSGSLSSQLRPMLVGLVGLVVLFVTGPVAAQSPSGQRQSGFALIDDYVLQINGAISNDAVVYASERTRAILILSEDLPAPVLIWPRSRSVETLQMLKVARQPGGRAEILPDPVIGTHAPFLVNPPNVEFLVDGVAAALAPKPALIGLHGASEMTDYSAVYGQRAEAYEPGQELIDKLRGHGQQVRVRVFFGSWCPACGQMVPRIIKVAQQLGDDSPVQVEFYGLPQGAGFSADPEVQKYGIKQVPTAVVLVDGKEEGRISGEQWRSPERRLTSLLGIS